MLLDEPEVKAGYGRDNESQIKNKKKSVFKGCQILPYTIILYFNLKEITKLILSETTVF